MVVVEDRPRIRRKRHWTPAEQKEIEWLTDLLTGPTNMAAVMGIVGLQGSGKTLFMIWLSYKLNKYFDMPVVGDFHPKQRFVNAVNFTYIDDEKFNEEQINMIKVARKKGIEKQENELLENLWKESGVSYYMAAVMWDEVYQKMDVRRTLDPFSIRCSYVIFQYRHYQCILMMATPTIEMLDSKRFKKFVTHEVGCAYHANWRGTGMPVCVYTIYNRNTMKHFDLRIPVRKWIPMFDTNVMISPRLGTLGLKMKDK